MGTLFLLKGPHFDLAAAEAKAASFGWGWWEHREAPQEGVIFLETRKVPRSLGLTRFSTKVLAAGPLSTLGHMLNTVKLHIQGSFKVVLTNLSSHRITEREAATAIWKRLRNPKVDLAHPDTVIDVVLTSRAAYIGTRTWTNDDDFEARRTHLLPAMHPSGMHPAVARALITLTCAKRIHDPFCGAGGLLIEGGLSHRVVSGADIDPGMIVRARKNTAHFRLRPELRVADAILWQPRAQAIIADLPYGRNTTPKALLPLLEAFLARVSGKRVIIGLPAQLPMPKQWKVCAQFSIYVHKSMTRHFFVLEKH